MQLCCEPIDQANAPINIEATGKPEPQKQNSAINTTQPKNSKSMLAALQGVPKPALQTILGKELGKRVWQQVRKLAVAFEIDSAASRNPQNDPSANDITDEDIIKGLLGHLSRQAAKALQENGRLAKSVGLIVSYCDGVVVSERMRPMLLTSDAQEILDTALEALAKLPVRQEIVDTLELTIASVEAESAPAPSFTVNFALPLPLPQSAHS